MLYQVTEELKNRGYDAKIIPMSKNGVTVHGVEVIVDGKNGMIFYENSEWHELSVGKIASDIEKAVKLPIPFDIKKMLTKEYIEENSFLCIQPITNEDIVKKEYLGLELYVRCDADKGSLKINKNILEKVGLDEELLFAKAIENTEKSFKCTTLGDLLGFDDAFDMSVISLSDDFFGASALYYPHLFKQYCDKNDIDECYIIPSSIHELLVVSSDKGSAKDIRNMIKEVNDSQVSPEIRLSYNLYKYSVKDNVVEVA